MARPVMRMKNLQSNLEDVHVFEKPNMFLEQYPTNPGVAAEMLHMMQAYYEDITGKMVADLGCGCGILSLGSAMLEADYILGIDIDEDALEVCQRNLNEYEIENVDLLQQDVLQLHEALTVLKHSDDSVSRPEIRLSQMFDTVVMNPPFGTKNNEGIDMKFVETGLCMARTAVYSLHKSTTRSHIEKKAKEWRVKMEILIPKLQFVLPKTLKMHKKDSVKIEIDLIRFSHDKKR